MSPDRRIRMAITNAAANTLISGIRTKDQKPIRLALNRTQATTTAATNIVDIVIHIRLILGLASAYH